MKASELRIGNLVKAQPFEGIITVFNNDKCVVKHKSGIVKYLIEDLEPIPLTEEWLLKFGFEKQHNEEDFDYWFKNDFSNDIIWEHSEGFCHNLNYGGDIKYVHQLQNLYFALTNEELTYEQQK